MSLPGRSQYTDLYIAAPFWGWTVNEAERIAHKGSIHVTVEALSTLIGQYGWRRLDELLGGDTANVVTVPA